MCDSVFPPEILDYILDFLHNEPETLKQCCLVSKSWVPRCRQYLFANINFYSAHRLESWNNAFPDPTNSPGFHVRNLVVDCHPEGTVQIRAFPRVLQLKLTGTFDLFHGFSHNLRSLSVRLISFSCPQLFNFICSFPLLEDLCLVGEEMSEDEDDGHNFQLLQTSPVLTGSLKLIVFRGMGSAPRHLLSLPNGLRFRDLMFLLVYEEDLRWIRELVLKCSDTLECLDVKFKWSGTMDPIDLSKATKLKHLIFRLRRLGPGRVHAMLETITPQHQDLRQISIHLHFKRIPQGDVNTCRFFFGDDGYERWLELDRLLVQFWESRSIRPRVVVTDAPRGIPEMKDWVGCLFPGITARGIIDLAEED